MASAPQISDAAGGSTRSPRSERRDSGLLDRQPPANLEAERNILGSILLLPEVCDDVALIVRPGDFYDDAHQKIFENILALHDGGQRIDVTLLVERLKSAGQFDLVGGAAMIAELAQSVPTAANAEFYARIVHDKAVLRNLILTSTEIVRDAYEQADSSRDLLNRAEERIFSIRDERETNSVCEIKDVLIDAFEQIDARMENGDGSGVLTGFTDLDQLTGGMHPAELIIIAGRPSMGKTALAANIAEYVAVEAGKPTLFVSLEMARLELVQRIMCSAGEIPGEKIRTGFLSADDHQKLIEVSAKLGKSPMFIDDSPSRTVTEIAATARRIKRRHGLSLIVVDYLQLIQPDDARDPRQEQVAKMARRLKMIARELEVPLICLAQLNRQAEMTKDNRPKLSHLRESGAIEQDADVVMMVHREEYYLSAQERQALKDQGNPNNVIGQAEVILAKQRNGPTGEVKLHWFQQFTRFKNAETRSYDEFEQYGAPDEF